MSLVVGWFELDVWKKHDGFGIAAKVGPPGMTADAIKAEMLHLAAQEILLFSPGSFFELIPTEFRKLPGRPADCPAQPVASSEHEPLKVWSVWLKG